MAYPFKNSLNRFAAKFMLWSVLFPSLIQIPAKSPQAASNAVALRLVKSYSRTNLNLRLGRYITAEGLEARKLKLAKHSF